MAVSGCRLWRRGPRVGANRGEVGGVLPARGDPAGRERLALGAGRDVKSQLKVLKKMRHPYEDNSQLAKFGGTFQDFNDRVIQFGYIVLFAPAYPLAPFLAFVNNIVEIRLGGYKIWGTEKNRTGRGRKQLVECVPEC